MAENYVVNGDDLTSIADAIRTKTGETEGMSVEEMPAKIMSLSNDEDINNAVSAHNTDETAHPDIRERVTALEEGSVSADLAVAIADDISREAVSKHNTDTGAHPDIREMVDSVREEMDGRPTYDDFAVLAADCDNYYIRRNGDIFKGQIRAGDSYQHPSVPLLRNTKLVSTDTTPTVNGEINWTYK